MKKIENLLNYHYIRQNDEAIKSIENQLSEDEKLIWAYKPKYKFSITPLEVGGYDVALGPTNLYFIALGVCWVSSYKLSGNGQYMKSMFLFFLGLMIFTLPDMVKEKRRKNTCYAVSNKRIFFKLWGLRKSKRTIHSFKIDLIHSLSYEEYKDKSGVLYFILKEPPAFKTYDFSAGGSRHYPTFENIDTVIAVKKLVEETRKTL